MTIITALRESGESILIGADNGYVESEVIILDSTNKLKKHPKESIAWATSGNPTIGEVDFCRWLQSYNYLSSDWNTFEKEAIFELSRIIGEHRKLVKLSGAKENPEHDTAECLLVGWIDGTPEICNFGDAGKVQSYLSDGFCAIGKGTIPAWITNEAIKRIEGISPLTRLNVVMSTVVKNLLGGQRYCIWRVRKNEIETGLEKMV